MPYCYISPQVKLAVVHLIQQDILSVEQIADVCDVSRHTIYRVLKIFNETGDVVKPRVELSGWPCILQHDDIDYFLHLLCHNPDYFLDELLTLLESNCFVSVHFTTIHWERVHLHISTKRLWKIAQEWNERRCALWILQAANYKPEQLGFLDETSKDEQTPFRCNGQSKKGTRAVKRGKFVRERRVTATGLLTVDGVVSNIVVKGSMTQDV